MKDLMKDLIKAEQRTFIPAEKKWNTTSFLICVLLVTIILFQLSTRHV